MSIHLFTKKVGQRSKEHVFDGGFLYELKDFNNRDQLKITERGRLLF